MLNVILLVFLVFFLICGIETYSIGVDPTIKYARVNDTFQISCYVDKSDGKLNFFDGNDLVPESFIERINDTFILYKNIYPKPTKKNVTCKSEENIVGMSEVYIDDKIGPVKDFKCRSRDLNGIYCTFQKPFAYHKIIYHLYYVINDGEKHTCRLTLDLKGGYSCNITLNENSSKSNLSFIIRARSDFFKRKENFELNFLETLLPRQIEDVRISKPQNASSLSKVLIFFKFPRELTSVSREMMFEVKIKAKGEIEWQKFIFKNYERNRRNENFIILRDIKYANTIYYLKVRMKAKVAMDTDEMWSPYVEESFKTDPKLPEILPNICENCYDIMDNGNIYLYWTEVSKFYQNGDNFSYLLRMINPYTNIVLNETYIEKTSFTFTSKINVTHLHIQIFTSNEQGLSKDYKYINVYLKRVKNLFQVKKEWIDRRIGYKLSWKSYDNVNDIESYTVIWCRQISELPNQCDGPIKFINLPPDEKEFYFNSSYSHQFGIAVNTLSGKQSGIQWAKCTSSRPDEIGILHSLWSKYVTENSILFEWKINCADKDIISAYIIQYCIVVDFDEKLCLDNQIYKTFNVSNDIDITSDYQITNLKPYRKYNISMALVSTSGRTGAFSKPIMIRTLEGSPSAPNNLEAIDVQSDRIELQWSRPIEVNAASLTYQLWYNDKMIHIDNNDTMKDKFNYILDNLEPFSNYTITVVACTRNCSHSSGSLNQRTRIGKPSRMNQINMDVYTNGTMELSWQNPTHLGGYLDFFLLNVSVLSLEGQKVLLYKIHNQRNSCTIQALNCDKSDLFLFSIRGVNIDDMGQLYDTNIYDTNECFGNVGKYNEKYHYYGDISFALNHDCRLRFGSSWLAFAMVVCVVIIIILFVLYRISRAFRKLQDMNSIQILLPDGLDSISLHTKDPIASLVNFDLIKTCTNLEKIHEESFKELELYENDGNSRNHFFSAIENQVIAEEHLIPLVPKSHTIDLISNRSLDNDIKSFSVPTTPLKQSTIGNTDYIQMHQPQKATLTNTNVSVEGYLDMSGKSSISDINNQSPEKSSKVIRSFIQNSQLNNGYIQRKSIIRESFPIINSNGYVGFFGLKK